MLYVLPVGLSLGALAISFPLLIQVTGPLLWGKIALGQTIGSLTSLFVLFGWGVVGPTSVALLKPAERPAYFASSFFSRLAIAAIVVPIGAVVVGLLVRRLEPVIFVSFAAVAVGGLGGSWYFIGEARPDRNLLFDALPRLGGILVGIGVLVYLKSAISYASAQLLGALVAASLSLAVVQRDSAQPLLSSARGALRRLTGQASAVGTAAVAATYTASPVIIMGVIAPTFLAQYALLDKLVKIANTAFSVLLQILQGWVPARSDLAAARRRVAVRLSVGVGTVAAVGWALLLPVVGNLLSGGAISLGPSLSVPSGIAVGLIVISQCTGLVLLASDGRMSVVFVSTLSGAALGIPSILVGAVVFGAVGVAWAVTLSEGVVLAIQIVALARGRRSRVDAPV